jgi:hypothetical protein
MSHTELYTPSSHIHTVQTPKNTEAFALSHSALPLLPLSSPLQHGNIKEMHVMLGMFNVKHSSWQQPGSVRLAVADMRSFGRGYCMPRMNWDNL